MTQHIDPEHLDLLSTAPAAFEKHFSQRPVVAARAPGRVEMLGNHTDYNGGYVLAAAIDRATVVTGVPSGDRTITLCASDFEEDAEFSGGIERSDEYTWANYVLGVVDQLRKVGVSIGGFRALLRSDIPIGAGLSSSAALEVATALFLKQLFPYEMSKMEIAQLCQRAENQFVGVNSGLLDQFASTFGSADSLVFLDCLTLEHDQVSLGRDDLSLVICDSMAKHSLVGGDYNTRYAECMAAAAHFGKKLLREVSIEEFEARKGELPENQRKRAEHVLHENQRVLAAIAALRAGDIAAFGGMMTASHQSSRTLFENSTPELDFLVDTALTLKGCYGARLTGGGWGGATVNLVETARAQAFQEVLTIKYQVKTGKMPKTFICAIADGAQIVPV